MTLSQEEKVRYQRQIIMPEIGADGQEKLKKSKVFLAGLGGLGSISAYYLVAAGIGQLRIVDGDRVAMENLNRQILHWTDDTGMAKTASAAEKLSRLNPDCHIDTINTVINEDNVSELVGDCCLIMDGTDNLKTRKVLNRTSVRNKIPMIFGGVEGLNGTVTTFVPGKTGCLECILPFEENEKKTIGVIGPVPGIVASIQVLEAIKLILDLDGLLTSTLLYINTSDMSFTPVAIKQNPDCIVCGSNQIKHKQE